MGQKGNVVILGIFVADTAYRAARLPKLGETLLGEGFALGPGGKGSNQAVAAARAGGMVRFLTRLGRDAFADMARGLWAEAGVEAAVIESATPTGAAFIFLEAATGQNAIIVAPGAAGEIRPADLAAWHEAFPGPGVFLTQLEQPLPAAEAALKAARAAGRFTILNPAPAAPLPPGFLSLCDLVTPNESEAEALTGLPVRDAGEAEAAARALIAQGAGAALVTLGAQGALYLGPEGLIQVPPLNAGLVRDTVGAGDAFNGGLAAALAEGQDLRAALRFATATAALSVTRPGAAASMPQRAEIAALLMAQS